MSKKFIAPGAWFSFQYPSTWYEFEDQEGVFLFYNPNKWSGNFRISAYKGESHSYAENVLLEAANQNKKSSWTKLGAWRALYWQESFIEGDESYISHCWMIARGDRVVDVTFTTLKEGSVQVAEEIIASLSLEMNNTEEVIPIRLQEIAYINESFVWVATLVKKKLSKELSSTEKDLLLLQQLLDKSYLSLDLSWVCGYLATVIGVIVLNEVEGVNWVTLIKGKKEFPALFFQSSERIVLLEQEFMNFKMNKQKIRISDFFEACLPR